jgi:pimeloyl-ACP methyl ester carboxylesterase
VAENRSSPEIHDKAPAEDFKGADIYSSLSNEEALQRSAEAGEKFNTKIKDPFARFNKSMDGLNPDIDLTSESDLPAFDHEYPPELAQELRSPEMVADPQTGQKLNVLKLNWENKEDEPRVMVYLPPYNHAIGEGGTNYRLAELARQTGRPTIGIDHPQMGASEGLTDEQKRAFREGGGYGAVAEAELRVLQKLGVKDIDLGAISMGAFAAASIAELAEKYDIKVHNLVMVETLGIEEFSLLGLAGRFMKEGSNLDLDQTHPMDPKMIQATGQDTSSVARISEIASWAASIPKNDPRFVYARAMTQESIEKSLAYALQNNPDLHIQIVHGSESRVSQAEANARLAGNLEEIGGDRVGRAVFPGESHSVLESAKRFAATVELYSRD